MAASDQDGKGVATDSDESAHGLQAEIAQRRPFHSIKAEVTVGILRTAALIERHFAQVVASTGVTVQQYNVLRILRGAGPEGLPTLVIRDRMIHAAPGITRLLDKLEKAGLARRERASPDRRQVFCYITPKGLEVLGAARRRDAARRRHGRRDARRRAAAPADQAPRGSARGAPVGQRAHR